MIFICFLTMLLYLCNIFFLGYFYHNNSWRYWLFLPPVFCNTLPIIVCIWSPAPRLQLQFRFIHTFFNGILLIVDSFMFLPNIYFVVFWKAFKLYNSWDETYSSNKFSLVLRNAIWTIYCSFHYSRMLVSIGCVSFGSFVVGYNQP